MTSNNCARIVAAKGMIESLDRRNADLRADRWDSLHEIEVLKRKVERLQANKGAPSYGLRTANDSLSARIESLKLKLIAAETKTEERSAEVEKLGNQLKDKAWTIGDLRRKVEDRGLVIEAYKRALRNCDHALEEEKLKGAGVGLGIANDRLKRELEEMKLKAALLSFGPPVEIEGIRAKAFGEGFSAALAFEEYVEQFFDGVFEKDGEVFE